MTAKLFYRLVDAAAEKVYRAATTLGPAVGGVILDGMARDDVPSERKPGCFSDGTPYYENSGHAQWEHYYGDKR